jgi:hypothetical protein
MNKNLLLLFTLVLLAINPGEEVFAQKAAPAQPVGCIDANIRLQADGIKQHYVAQGFKVYRDAMINMSSQEPFPVMVQLTAGQLYEIIFVGQPAASNHKMILYDGEDKKIDEKSLARNGKSLSDEPTNYIIYEFVPKRTDMYLLTFMSRLKNKDFCGSVCIVAADRSKGNIRYKPYVP